VNDDRSPKSPPPKRSQCAEEFQTACKKTGISHAINELYGSRVPRAGDRTGADAYAKWLIRRVAMEEYGHHWR
jgi:hypothetical protein